MSLFRRMLMSYIFSPSINDDDNDDDDVIIPNLEYMYVESLEDGLTVSLSNLTTEYSTDKISWTTLSAGATTPSISNGSRIYFRATTGPIEGGVGSFSINKNCNIGGNIMSLLFGDNFSDKTDLTGYDGIFQMLFGYCSTIKSVADNFLTPLILSPYCYSGMFLNCSGLEVPPKLYSTTLSEGCYDSMFYRCTSLANAPKLPATTLSVGCYCYMFSDCSLLTTAPELPAINLEEYCYAGMFFNCPNLNYIKALFTTTPSSVYTDYWVYGVSSSGTFIKNSSATWNVNGENGIPNNWTVQTSN